MVCPHCKKAPYPIFDENKKVIWKNVFHIDWLMLVIVALLLFSAWAYTHDTAECRKMLSEPCKYIPANGCSQTGDDNAEAIYKLISGEKAG